MENELVAPMGAWADLSPEQKIIRAALDGGRALAEIAAGGLHVFHEILSHVPTMDFSSLETVLHGLLVYLGAHALQKAGAIIAPKMRIKNPIGEELESGV